MATPWPPEVVWPAELREHTTSLSKYLRDTLLCVDRTKGQPVPAELVKTIILGMLSFIVKTQNTPDLKSVLDALSIARTERDAALERMAESIGAVRNEICKTKESVQQCTTHTERYVEIGEQTKIIAQETREITRTVMDIAREIRNQGIQDSSSQLLSYAAVAARGTVASSVHNTQSLKTSTAQILREAIVNIRDPVTIQSLRAMNPRNLKAHVERAIEQSENEHVANIKVMSSNQLKSGDLSIKTATNSDTEALRQFADDWTHRIGQGATVKTPTYGILVHGIRTSTIDMDKFEDNKEQILQDNKPFIPRADIKYMAWLTRRALTKSASSAIIEFTRPEDANKIIDEGLVWQGEVFQCERYERQCRLKQCFNCQKYGHIGTQCKAPTACGYCAEEHASRGCPSKSDRTTARKCAACHGAHEAWNPQCPTRKDEIARAKAAYSIRAQYHPVPQTVEQQRATTGTLRRRRSARDLTQPQDHGVTSETLEAGRGQKRANPGFSADMADKENQPARERPQRTIVRSRRALEALEYNTLGRTNSQISSQQMDIDREIDQ